MSHYIYIIQSSGSTHAIAHAQSKLIGGHLDALDLWQVKDQTLRWLLLQNGYTKMVVMAILLIIHINETALYLYAPLLKGWIVAFVPSLWYMVRRKPGHQLTRGSSTWRVWMSPLFWKLKVSKEDLSLEETVTLDDTDLDPLGGIQIYNLTNGQIVFIPPSIHDRKPQYLADNFGLVFELLEEAKDPPKERRAVQGGYCFKYGSLHVRGYVPIPERMMESIENNLRWLTDVRHVPCYVVQTIYNL